MTLKHVPQRARKALLGTVRVLIASLVVFALWRLL